MLCDWLNSVSKHLLKNMINICLENSQLSGRGMACILRKKLGLGNRDIEKILGNPTYKKALLNVAESMLEYGITKPLKLLAPFLVVWNYTNKCNLKCRHCYQDAGKGLKNELNLEEKIATVHQLASMKIAYLAFSGGEPLLKDDFFLVAREASKMGIYTSVATNGTLLTKEMVNGIAEAGIKYIQISLDGAMPDSHDSLRGRIGCWKKTVQGIKNAVENGSFKVSLATTVTASNYPQFEKVLELAKKLRVDGLTIYNFVPTGRGKKMIKEDLNPEIREAMLKRAHQELSNGFDVLATAPQFSRVCIQSRRGKVGVAHFGKVESKMAEFVADILGGCGAGRVYCAIQPDGKVTPCVFIQLIAGDLRKEDFASIWRDSPLLNTLRSREDLKGWCGKCKFRSSCGGCRARALGYFNDLKGPDIGCILNRKWWEELRSVSS